MRLYQYREESTHTLNGSPLLLRNANHLRTRREIALALTIISTKQLHQRLGVRCEHLGNPRVLRRQLLD